MTQRPFASIPAAIRHWAAARPDAVAVADDRETWTFAELCDRVEDAATRLRGLGVEAGDRVVVVGHNTLAWVIAYLATLRAGAVVAPANNRLSPTQFAEQVELLDARLVLHDEEHVGLVGESLAAGRAIRRLDELQVASGGRPDGVGPPWEEPDPDAAALISFTSGTTGTPKGAVLSSSALFAGSAVFADYLGTTEDDSTLVLVPLFHNTGFVDQLGHMLVCGGRTNLLATYRTADAVAELTRRPVTFVTAVPSIIRLLVVADGADDALSGVRTVLFGGSPMPAAWSKELMERWPQLRLVHGYGLTEFTSACTFLPHELMLSNGESVGFPAPHVELKVVDGEVWVAGPTRMREYWQRPDLTAARFDGQWLRTGDLGHHDSRGLLWLTGRIDDVINRGGEKILPAFVESCLAELPCVAQAAVFGVPDGVLLHRVGAAVELRPGGTFSEPEAREHLSAKLPDYAVPEHWYVVDTLPRTASGKVDRRAAARLATPTAQEPT
jgi:acyl-CoA synthetase (AMP-forming)/AMP-acid ligase II